MTGALAAITIVLIAVGGITAMVVTYFQLQKHRADAIAMASYRKLAEEAIETHQQLRKEIVELNTRMGAIEKMMREVG